MDARTLESKINYLGMERDARKIIVQKGSCPVEAAALMTCVEVCAALLEEYEVVFAENERIAIVKREDVETFNSIVEYLQNRSSESTQEENLKRCYGCMGASFGDCESRNKWRKEDTQKTYILDRARALKRACMRLSTYNECHRCEGYDKSEGECRLGDPVEWPIDEWRAE